MLFGAPGVHILSCGLRSWDIICMVFLPSISGSPQISACWKAYHSFVHIFANMTIVVCMLCLGYHKICCSRIWSYFPGWEDPLEKEMAIHSSILAWKIPQTEEPGGLQSMGSQESDTTQQLNHHPQGKSRETSLGPAKSRAILNSDCILNTG